MAVMMMVVVAMVVPTGSHMGNEPRSETKLYKRWAGLLWNQQEPLWAVSDRKKNVDLTINVQIKVEGRPTINQKHSSMDSFHVVHDHP